MLLREEIDELAARAREEPDLAALRSRLRQRTEPVRQGAVAIPRLKALLSRNGGVCPDDRVALRFDPVSPTAHACPRCGKAWSGERHDRHWARSQHLWLAERAVDLALLGALEQDTESAAAAAALLRDYGTVYQELPNRDNVLGPSHLFFSTYLESMWVVSYLAAAQVLRETDLLPDDGVESINGVADEAAGLIGGFNEGLSNRQTWHAAALAAIAAWFGDEELAQTAIEARTGLLGHLTDGFGEDGLWFEGENYHLFAIRGLMLGLQWARTAGTDLLADPELRRHFREALLAPARSALPDFTFPARGDARYGSSLAQPAFLELWEIGRAWLTGDGGEGGGGDEELDGWLAALYALSSPAAEHYDAWLHDAGIEQPAARTRRDLSWWALTMMAPTAPAPPGWQPASRLFADQGLAVLRQGDRYASLECGPRLGGHGHPDRLHFTLHADGIHWLADPGTGSYVEASLTWYRSALAHGAPILDGENVGGAPAWCGAFDARDGWAWARGRAGELTRTVVLGPDLVVDVVELEAKGVRHLDLPWHLPGSLDLEGLEDGGGGREARPSTVLDAVERIASAGGTVKIRSRVGDRTLAVHVLAPGAAFANAPAPGPPGTPDRTVLLVRTEAAAARWVSVLDLAPGDGLRGVAAARVEGDRIEIETGTGGGRATVRLRFDPTGLTVEAAGHPIPLAGLLAAPSTPVLREAVRFGWDALAVAPRAGDPPALDGTGEGFDGSHPLLLEGEQHYRPSEEPFDPEEFSARAWVNWDDDALYLAVDVTKSDLVLRPAGAAPLELDNEPDDIHADGLQVYLEPAPGSVIGLVISLEEGGGLRGRGVAGTEGDGRQVTGAWVRTETGYRVTMRVEEPRLAALDPEARVGFDLIVNEMRPGRQRRAGQLVWSGGDGWVYLRGDRQDHTHFGRLELG